MGKDEKAKKKAMSGGVGVKVSKMSKKDPPVAMGASAAIGRSTLEASKHNKDMKESNKGRADPPASAPGLNASVQSLTATVASSRVRVAVPPDTTDVPLTRRPTADESKTLAPPQRPVNTRDTMSTTTSTVAPSSVSTSPAPVALGHRPTVDDSASLAPPQQPSLSTAEQQRLQRLAEDATSEASPVTSSFAGASAVTSSTSTTTLAGTPPPPPQRQSDVSQPGAFRMGGVEPWEDDDIHDDISLAPDEDDSKSSSSVSSASGSSINNNILPAQLSLSGQATQPAEVTAYLVTEEATASRSSSNAEELRDQIQALHEEVQQLAQQTAEQRNSSSSLIVVAEPMEDTTANETSEHDDDDDEPELNPTHVSPSDGRSNGLHLLRESSATTMSNLSASNHNMDASMSSTMDAASASQFGLVVALREDRDARQQERVVRAERRASKRQERKQAQRRKMCLWNCLYLVIAVVLGVALYLIFQSGVADPVLEKLDGATDKAQDEVALDDLAADGASAIPTPEEISTGPLIPTTTDDATTATTGGDAGNNSANTIINNTNNSTTTTTTQTTNGGDTPLFNSDTLPGIMAGGLATGVFLLMIGCSCTSRRKITHEADTDLDIV